MRQTIANFKQFFNQLKTDEASLLSEIYADDIVFKDPIHQIKGSKNLKQYFEKLNGNLIEGSFTFTDDSIIENKAYLCWEINLRLKRPKKQVNASGISVLTFREGKVIEQRDYFDAAELFYEHIPILGGIIRLIKKKIAAKK